MNTRCTQWLLITLLSASLPGLAVACGETLFRTGSSMRQHMQTTQAPARILVLADSKEDSPQAQEKLYEGLRRVGHQVDQVASAEALAAALESAQYDLVLAHQSEVPSVMLRLEAQQPSDQENKQSAPTLIPILAQGTRKLEPFKVCIKEGAELGTVLRAVARAMRESSP